MWKKSNALHLPLLPRTPEHQLGTGTSYIEKLSLLIVYLFLVLLSFLISLSALLGRARK
jgi:hypothetical protein